MTAKERGDWGEAQVAEYLRRRGFRIIATQFRCRLGEIDLIARSGRTLCFVEVKLRSSLAYGLPREFVTRGKQRKLRMAASYYLASHNAEDCCRFDVAEVYTDKDCTPANTRIEYIENAFF